MMLLKIGGGAAINLEAIASDIANLEEPTVIVHGANALRDQLANELGKEIQTVTSLSGFTSVLSDENTIDLMMMSYAGLRNKRLVELLQQKGVNAIGLSGVDGGLIRARRNRGIKTKKDGRKMLLRDLSGKPFEVNAHLLNLLIEGGYTPVITVPVIDEEGHAVNTENDEIIALLQSVIQADRVVQLIEAPGLLRDISDPESLVNVLSHEVLEDWENEVEGRMRRKIHALRKLFAKSSPAVHIGDGRIENPITNLTLNREGTLIS